MIFCGYAPSLPPLAPRGTIQHFPKRLILSPGDIPTTDYYLSSRFGQLENSPLVRLDARRLPDAIPALQGYFVVIVRHASPEWLGLLAAHQHQLAGVIYLMDDDIPAAWRCWDVPLDYGLWTSTRYWRIRHRLAQVCDEWWISTPELARRYPGSRLVPPLPFAMANDPAPVGCRRWAYHGTRVHERELRWIVPIVEAVQKAVPKAEFEVFGGQAVQRLFAHIPRVTVRPPLPWPEYVAYCRANPLAVGLAPLLPGRFNAARSHTKAFDILRCGAVGLFSNRPPYSTALAGSGAILLPDEPQRWVEWAIRLLQEDGMRQALFKEMYAFVSALKDEGLEGLFRW